MAASAIDRREIEDTIARHSDIKLRLEDRFERGATGAYSALVDSGSRVVVKVSVDPDLREKMDFASANLPRLKARGYPVAALLAHGPIREGRSFAVFEHIDGDPPKELDESLLEQLMNLVEFQADAGVEAPNRNWSWLIRVVLFDGQRGLVDKASAASASSAPLVTRLREIVGPSKDLEMHSRDFVHGDFGPHNVVLRDGQVSGVLDWMNSGIGNRAVDLGEIVVAWTLLQQEGREVPPDGASMLLERIRKLAGDEGMLQIMAYQLVAGLAFWRTQGTPETVERWVRAGSAIIDRLV